MMLLDSPCESWKRIHQVYHSLEPGAQKKKVFRFITTKKGAPKSADQIAAKDLRNVIYDNNISNFASDLKNN